MIVRTPDVFDLKRKKSFQFMKTESYILYIGSIWISFNPIKGGTLYKRRNWSLFLFCDDDDVHHFR